MLINKKNIKFIKKWLKESFNLSKMQAEYYIKLLEMNPNNKSGRYKILRSRKGGMVVYFFKKPPI